MACSIIKYLLVSYQIVIFQYCDRNIRLFAVAFYKVIALLTIAVVIVERAKSIERATEKRDNELMYKTHTKINQ